MVPVTDSFDCHGIWLRLLIQPKLLSTFELSEFHLEYLLNLALSDGMRSYTSDFDVTPAQQAKAQLAGNNSQKPQRNPLILADGSEKEFQEKKLANVRYLILSFIILLKYDTDKLVHVFSSRQLEFLLLSMLRVYEVETYPMQFRRYAILLYYRLAVSFVIKNAVSVKKKYHHVVSIISMDQQPAEHENYLFQRLFGEVAELVDSIEKIVVDEGFWRYDPKKICPEEHKFIVDNITFSRDDVRNDLKQWSKFRNTDNGQVFQEAIANQDRKKTELKAIGTDFSHGFFHRRGVETLKRSYKNDHLKHIYENFLLNKDSKLDQNRQLESTSKKSIPTYSSSKTKKPRFQYYSQTDFEKSLKMISGLKPTEFEIEDQYVLIRMLKNDNKVMNDSLYNKSLFLLKKAKMFIDEGKYQEARSFLEHVKKDKKSLGSSYMEMLDAELLDIDIQQFKEKNIIEEMDKNIVDPLRNRCVTFLKNHTDDIFRYQREIVENCCHFLMDFDEDALKDFCKDKNPFIKFVACLCQPLIGPENKNKCLEVWNVALGFLSATRNSASRTSLTQSQSEYFSFISFLKQISNIKFRMIIATMFAKFFNILRNNSMSGSISFNFSYPFPDTIVGGHKKNIDTREFSTIFSELIRHYLNGHYNVLFLQMYGEFLVAEDMRNCDQAFNYFLRVLYIKTNGFNSDIENFEDILQHLVNCSSKARYHVRAAYFYQFLALRNINCYALAFKELSQENSNDSLGTYLEYFWDISFLEWLHSNPRFETHFGDKILELIRLPELNENNHSEVKKQAISARTRGFFSLLLESSTI